MNDKMVSGVKKKERDSLREELNKFVINQATMLGYPEEAIVQEIRYWQQSANTWKTNASKAEKKRSFSHHNQECQACKKRINSFVEATFHHYERGISNQHEPNNMVPLHRDKKFGCHEKIHGARPGSFTE